MCSNANLRVQKELVLWGSIWGKDYIRELYIYEAVFFSGDFYIKLQGYTSIGKSNRL